MQTQTQLQQLKQETVCRLQTPNANPRSMGSQLPLHICSALTATFCIHRELHFYISPKDLFSFLLTYLCFKIGIQCPNRMILGYLLVCTVISFPCTNILSWWWVFLQQRGINFRKVSENMVKKLTN